MVLEMERSLMRKHVARDIDRWDDSISYDQALSLLEKWDVFGDWDWYEICNRPIDVEDLYDCIYIELYGY